MANYTAEVVRYIRRKGSDGFSEPATYLGAEQRFVGALRNSSVNNLEEQYILGTDSYTEKYTNENGDWVTEKSYHINDAFHSITDYYKLVTTTPKDGSTNKDFFFEENELKLPSDSTEALFGTGESPYDDIQELYCVNETTFNEDSGILKVFPSSYTVVQEDDLYYITNNGASSIHVSNKITSRKYMSESEREVTREIITNYLKSTD